MIKIDFSVVLLDLQGKPLKRDGNESFTLSKACVEALMLSTEQDRNETGEVKLQRYMLAQQLNNAQIVELTPEQIVFVKNYVGKLYSPAVVGPAFTLLNKDCKSA
jgi:hypothetical protein